MKWIRVLFLLVVVLNAEVNLNFRNLEIKDFIKMVAKITNKNILISQPITGKVNFVSVKPLKEDEVYSLLLSVLATKGYTLIEDNGYLKLVRANRAYKEAPPLSNNTTLPEIQTSIIPLKYISATDAFREINYFLSPYGKLAVDKNKNLIIITDFLKNIKNIKSILKSIDDKNKKDVRFYKLKNVEVKDVLGSISNILAMIFDPKVYKYRIIPNYSSNEIVIVGKEDILKKSDEIIANLDKKSSSLNLTTAIINLNNSDAKNMEKLVKAIISQKYKTSKQKPSVTADEETNSLIILGTKNQLDILKNVIKNLDVPKKQVYVKAKILEISNTKASQIGAKFGLLGGFADASSGIYTMSANLGGVPLAFNPGELGLSIPNLKQGIALGVTVNLLETLGAAKKLSEPSILCINNTPSTIYVGKTVSVLTGKTTSTSTSESYSRQDIGLTLKVKPRIDSDNKVALNVNAIIEDILPGSQTTLPITSKRKISTNAIVKNGETIILGGLVRNNDDITTSKVPLLGDIPVIGSLFRHNQKNKDKTTIVILLTPYIVNNSEELAKLRITLSKLNMLESKFTQKIINQKIKRPSKKQTQSNQINKLLGETYEEDR